MDVVARHANSLITFPQDKGIAHRVLIGTSLLPLGSTPDWCTSIIIVHRVVVGSHASNTSFIHHGETNVLKNVVFDQIIRTNKSIRRVMI